MALSETADELLREAVGLDRAGRAPEAILAYERILARWPGLADVWYELALLQRKTGLIEAALASYQQALAHGIARPEEVHLNRGVLYADFLGQHAAAERELAAALALNRRYVPALLNLANLHADFGRREAARALLDEALALEPHNSLALARRADLEPAPPVDAALLARLRAALATASAAADRADLGFALGRLLDAGGEYRAAFAAYARAKHDSRATLPAGQGAYSRAQHAALVDRLIAAPTAARGGAALRAAPRPIFICGMFRSGSTLLEQILGRAKGVATGGEIDFLPRLVAGELAPFPESLGTLPPASLGGLANRYLDELAVRHPGAAQVTDKRPDNFLNIGLIKALFPDARIVHTTREPLDNCLSIFFLHMNPRMAYALELMDIGHYFREYRRLMAHWQTRFGEDIHELNYDALVRAPETTLAPLWRFLDLEPVTPATAATDAPRPVKTASVWQVREPLYQRASGRAAHYAPELAELARYLDERVGR